jgi:hypothetical protein
MTDKTDLHGFFDINTNLSNSFNLLVLLFMNNV